FEQEATEITEIEFAFIALFSPFSPVRIPFPPIHRAGILSLAHLPSAHRHGDTMIPSRFDHLASVTRPHFLTTSSLGLGGLALANLLGGSATAGTGPSIRVTDPLAPKAPHFPAKAKNVIVLHMSGAPPHLDMFDYKPELVKNNDKPCPESLVKGKRFAFTSGVPKLLGPPQNFKQRGKCGAWVSDVLPGIASIADDLTCGKSIDIEQVNHAPVELLLYTGPARQGRPSTGTWVTYGLGSESRDLPGFIVLVSGGVLPSAGRSAWGSGFLPSVFQGVQCRTGGDPVLYVTDPEGMDRGTRRLRRGAIHVLGARHHRA